MTINFEILTHTSQNTAKHTVLYSMAFAFILQTYVGHKMHMTNKWYLKEHSGFKKLVFKIFKDRTFFKKFVH